jgi:hypothetical protein
MESTTYPKIILLVKKKGDKLNATGLLTLSGYLAVLSEMSHHVFGPLKQSRMAQKQNHWLCGNFKSKSTLVAKESKHTS